jgi:hypothetical protein
MSSLKPKARALKANGLVTPEITRRLLNLNLGVSTT